jgi:hypothetical protein
VSQSRCTLAILVLNDSPDTVYSVPSTPSPARSALQNVSPNKRRFNTVEDAAVAKILNRQRNNRPQALIHKLSFSYHIKRGYSCAGSTDIVLFLPTKQLDVSALAFQPPSFGLTCNNPIGYPTRRIGPSIGLFSEIMRYEVSEGFTGGGYEQIGINSSEENQSQDPTEISLSE